MSDKVLFSTQLLGASALSAVVAYLLGSISFAVIFSRLFAHDDVRQHGSGNAGTTNVLRSVGVVPGILTFFCDFAKGALAVLGSRLLLRLAGAPETALPLFCIVGSVAGMFAIIGHLFPVFFGFKGGKGVMTLAGVVFMLSPLRFLVLFGIFLVIFAITRTVSIGSMIGAALYPVVTYIQCGVIERANNPALYTEGYVAVQVIAAVLFAGMVIFQHRSNIKRLLEGTEPKLVIKRG